MYVAATHCDQVELFLNGKSLGVQTKPTTFVDPYGGQAAGRRAAAGVTPAMSTPSPTSRSRPARSRPWPPRAARSSRRRNSRPPGEPAAIKLTVHTGPHGLQADGSDVALVDFEVVDAQGRRCPTDEARVDFAVTGPAVWRGGFNSAMLNSTNNLYLDTECGINRVAIRSTLDARHDHPHRHARRASRPPRCRSSRAQRPFKMAWKRTCPRPSPASRSRSPGWCPSPS